MKKLLAAALLALLFPVLAGAAEAPAPAAAAGKKPAAAAATKAPAKGGAPAVGRPAPAGKAFDAIRKRGTLLVGTAWNIPWAMRDPQGEWLGFEIDIARQLAADMGVDMTIVRIPFNEFTDALASGKIDVVVAGYSITPQRALAADFTNAYAESQMELVVRKDLAGQDPDRADFKLGARAGTTAEAAARGRFGKAQVMPYDDERKLYAALKDGQVDGALAYVPRTTIAVAQSDGRFAVAPQVTGLPRTVEAFAVRRGEQSLLNFLNAWIAYWKADGWIAERHRYWFETLDWTPRFARPGAM